MLPEYFLIGLELAHKFHPHKHDPSDQTPKIAMVHIPEEPTQRGWEMGWRNMAAVTTSSPVSYPPLVVVMNGDGKSAGYSQPVTFLPFSTPMISTGGVTE